MADFIPMTPVGSPTQKYLGRQYDAGGKLEHFRMFREDLQPSIDRVKEIAQSGIESKEGMRYVGSVNRVVVHDWLLREGKNWHDFATDRDLKAKFMAWYRTNFSKMIAKTYQERSLKTNRATAPRLGAQILGNYRKEIAGA